MLYLKVMEIFVLFLSFSLIAQAYAQSISVEDLVTYTKQSGFIQEFDVPIQELGLKGIITDDNEKIWLYHFTNKTSSIFRFDSKTKSFTQYNIQGDTVVETPIINLAGGQLTFDKSRNTIWFTDARTNSIGKLSIDEERIELIPIPTQRAGPMGITISPDEKSVWFAEIIGDKIAKLDIESGAITEYSTGKETGPTLLTFDDKGILWVTSSYSNNIFRVEPRLLDSAISGGITSLTLPKPDLFSPFGIAVLTASDGMQKIFVSDHGSSRVIFSDDNLQSYVSYWTSPSKIYPTTLPSQIAIDKDGNIYFVQHGGNRISKIDAKSGMMTEYDIPTGPLSTVVYLAVSEDGKRVWFTEWATNKIGYLDVETSVPFELQINNDQAKLQRNTPYDIVALVTSEAQDSPILPSLGLAVVGMSDGGLKGITYSANPQWFNMTDSSQVTTKIILEADNTAPGGKHTLMVRVSAFEKDNLVVSKLLPVSVTLDPTNAPFDDLNASMPKAESISLDDITGFLAMAVAAGLVGLLIYNRIKGANKLEN